MESPKEVVPFEETLWKTFRRTYLIDAGARRLDEIPELVQKVLKEADSLLVVCNKKSEAEFLYRAFAEKVENCFHLSASMCIAHRRATLEKLKQALTEMSGKILCVAKQVIEAGWTFLSSG